MIDRHSLKSKLYSGADPLSARALLIILILALLVRGVAFSRLHQGILLEDLRDYDAYGWRIATTGEAGSRYKPVGFPLFLALIYSVFGHSPTAALIVLGSLGALSAPVLAAATSVVGGRRKGWWAGLVLAFYPGVVFHHVILASEGFASILVTMVVAAALLLLHRPGAPLAAAAGLASGWLGLIRTPLLPVGPLIGLGLLLYGRRRVGIVLAVVSLVPTLVWAAQTKRGHGHWMVGDWNAGFNLYLGNNPQATGRFRIPEDVYTHPFSDEFERDTFYRKAALRYIQANPLQAGRLILARLAYLMNSEHKDLIYLYSKGWLGERSRAEITTILMADFLGWLLLAPFAIWGTIARWRELEVRLALLAVAGGLVLYLATLGDSRYHVPVVPGVVVLGAWGVTTRFRLREVGAGRAVVLGVLLSLFLANIALDVVETWPIFQRVTSPGGSSVHYGYHQLR
jgi:4-amino-4-deoxy-L-arabinose transferase-like glycosyltransferase